MRASTSKLLEALSADLVSAQEPCLLWHRSRRHYDFQVHRSPFSQRETRLERYHVVDVTATFHQL